MRCEYFAGVRTNKLFQKFDVRVVDNKILIPADGTRTTRVDVRLISRSVLENNWKHQDLTMKKKLYIDVNKPFQFKVVKTIPELTNIDLTDETLRKSQDSKRWRWEITKCDLNKNSTSVFSKSTSENILKETCGSFSKNNCATEIKRCLKVEFTALI